jgi:flagellin
VAGSPNIQEEIVGIRINQNVMAMNAYRNLTTTEGQLSRSLERLSSGFRINRAADDAAGLVISEGLRAQVNGLKMATRNAQDGVSVVQTAEGALTETHAILQRMRELAVQAASTGSSDQPSRDAAQVEVVQLKAELDRIANTTKFGEQTLLDGTYGVTQASRSASSVAQTVTWATGDDFTIDIDGAGGLTAVTVELTAPAAAYDAAVAGSAADLEADLQSAIDAALGSVAGANSPIKVSVTQSGVGAAARFNTTISGNVGNNITIADGTGTPLANVTDGLGAALVGSATTSGSGGSFQVGSGTSANDKINITIGNMTSAAAGLNLTAVDVSNSAISTANITAIDAAITEVSTLRGNLGAYQNRFERTISNLSVTTENLSASESRIRDTDMASEMMSFTRAQILQQAGTAMLAQANSVPQSVLQLLQ